MATLTLSSAKGEFEVREINFEVSSDNSSSTFQKPKVRISGGSSARDTQFPFVAEININVQNGQLLCSGSLIAKDWIVSARHCIAE